MASLIRYTKKLIYSSGLGFFPITLLLNLDIQGEQYKDIKGLYDDISNQSCPDLIFHGDIERYQEELLWLLPRLISEMYAVSIVMNISKLIPLIARRVILCTDYMKFRKSSSNIENLGENDLILLQENDLGKFKWLRHNLIKTFRGKIFFDEQYMSRQNVLASNIYDLFPVDLSW